MKEKETQTQQPEEIRLAPTTTATTDGHADGGVPGGPNGPPIQVALTRPDSVLTPDHALWGAIRNRTDAISFDNYSAFITRLLCSDTDVGGSASSCGRAELSADDLGAPTIDERRTDLLDVPSIYGVDAYNLLKVATQAFLLLETGVAVRPPRDINTGVHETSLQFVPGERSRTGRAFTFEELTQLLNDYVTQAIGSVSGRGLPYLKRITDALFGQNREEKLPFCYDLMRNRFSCPSLLELIWSYWHEEGMLVQTMNAVCMRFQNRRGPVERDPLAALEMDALRPLNNLLWGYIQDEYSRLTVPRRAYEYDHHYGLKIMGKAVPELRSADSRSKFIEAFHNLLYRTAVFYRSDADTTVIADGFPLLNALREVHLLLAEGAHNQFGDLPWTSRAEMLMMQWLLGRPEMREFLRGRAMVPYQERWMGQVDTMNRLQGWTDTSITHFRNLAAYGEQILLSVRYGDWIGITDQDIAKTWARYWRGEVQAYIHSYLAATGVDLSEDISSSRDVRTRYIQPAVLLRERALAKPKQAELPSPAVSELPAGGVSYGAIPTTRRRALSPARKD